MQADVVPTASERRAASWSERERERELAEPMLALLTKLSAGCTMLNQAAVHN